MADIFISHAAGDYKVACLVADWLKSEGFESYFLARDPERGISSEADWIAALAREKSLCKLMLCLVSSEWLGKDECRFEFRSAIELDKQMTLINIDSDPTVPARISQLPGASVRNQTDFSSIRSQLALLTGKPPGELLHVIQQHPQTPRLQAGLARAGLDSKIFPWPWPGDKDIEPFKGLAALTENDVGIYFGRHAERARCLRLMNTLHHEGQSYLLQIQGASGTGKSSFMRAGLFHRLKNQSSRFVLLPVVTADESRNVAILLNVVRDELVRHRLMLPSVDGAERNELFENILALERGTRPKNVETSRTIVLMVDQAEQLFREADQAMLKELEVLAHKLLRAPGAIAPQNDDCIQVAILFSIRSDALPIVQQHPSLRNYPRHSIELLPLERWHYKDVIEGPASAYSRLGYRLEIDDSLLDELLKDVSSESADPLPLLAQVLQNLYRKKHIQGQDCRLELTDYKPDDATRSGRSGLSEIVLQGIENALSEAGLSVFPVDYRLSTELFPKMARWSHATDEVVRRRFTRKDLNDSAVIRLINLLIDARLFRGGVDEMGGNAVGDARNSDFIEVTHEAVLRHWPGLKDWYLGIKSDLIIRDAVVAAARQYQLAQVEKGVQHASELLVHRGARLKEAEEILKLPDLAASDSDRSDYERAVIYLAACRRRQNKSNSVVFSVAASILVFGVGALVWGASMRARDMATSALLSVAEFSVSGRFDLATLLRYIPNSLGELRASSGTSVRPVLGALNQVSPAFIGFFSMHASSIATVSINRDDWVLSSSESGAVKLGEILKNGVLSDVRQHEFYAGVIGAHFIQKNLAVVATRDAKAHVVELPSFLVKKTLDFGCSTKAVVLPGKGPTFSTVSPDGNWLAVGFADGNLNVINLMSGQSKGCRQDYFGGSSVHAVAFSPDSSRLAITSRAHQPGYVAMLDLATMNIIWKSLKSKAVDGSINYGCRPWAYDVRFYKKDSREYVVAGCSSQGAVTFSAADGNYLGSAADGFIANTVPVSQDGEWLAVGQNTHAITLVRNDPLSVDVAGQPRRLLGHAGQVVSAEFSYSGRYLVSGDDQGQVIVWDLHRAGNMSGPTDEASTVDARIKPGGMALALSVDGRRLFTGMEKIESKSANNMCESRVAVWDTKSRSLVREIDSKVGHIINMRMISDGLHAIVGLSDDSKCQSGSVVACLLDVHRLDKTGDWDCKPLLRGGQVWATAHNPVTGEIMVSRRLNGSGDGYSGLAPKLFESGTDGSSTELRLTDERGSVRFDHGILSADFSPDGRWLAYGGYDNRVTVVDWHKRHVIRTFQSQLGVVRSVRFSPDGRWLAAGTEGEEILIWAVDSPGPVEKPVVLRGRFGVVSLAFTGSAYPDFLLVGKGGGGIDIIDLKAERPSPVSLAINTENDIMKGEVWSMAVSPDDGTLYAISNHPFLNALGESGGSLLTHQLALTPELALRRACSFLAPGDRLPAACEKLGRIGGNKTSNGTTQNP